VTGSQQRRYDWVTFTSDYGLDDIFVGVCKGVVARIAPHVRILDVSHFVHQQDVEHGADTFAAAAPYLPVAVHLVLVDPIEIVASRGVVLETTDGSLMVGPDNGLMSRAWDARGGVGRAFEVDNPLLWADTVHQTFRGRDVFSPVAAHLAAGRDVAEVGPAIAPDSLTRLAVRGVVVDDDHVHGEVSLVDHFGNVALSVLRTDLEAAGIRFGDTVELRLNGQTHTLPFRATYADVARGRLTLCEDSFHAVQLARNGGHAGRLLRVGRGDPVVISRLPRATEPA
jgi:S-adenosyl-L-methionine hydrolase (adenosine-forming)